MKKTHSTNIGGRIFEVEEDAFQQLTAYLASMSTRFQSYPDAKDIVADIEARIAEHLVLNAEASRIVTHNDVVRVMNAMGRADELGDTDETPEISYRATSDSTQGTHKHTASTANAGMTGTIGAESTGTNDRTFAPGIARPRIFRDPDERVIAGVASGLAAYFDISPTWIRLLFLVSLFLGGTGLIVYLVLWLCIPRARTLTDRVRMRGERVTLNTIDQGLRDESLATPPKRSSTMRMILRVLIACVVIIVLVSMGIYIGIIGSEEMWSYNRIWSYNKTWSSHIDMQSRLRVDTVLSVGTKPTVDLSAITGDINVMTGPASQVKVFARTVGDVEIDFTMNGSTIRVHETPGDRSCANCSATINVTVPPGTSIISAAVSGAQTVAATQGDVFVRTISGDIKVQDARTVIAEALSGDITVILLDTAHMTVDASTMSGEIETDFSSTAPQEYRLGRHMVIPLNGGGAPIKVKTADGDIAIRRKF